MEPWIEYMLPPELVAQEPLRNRADARLMLIRREEGTIEHLHVRDIPQLLQPGDRLVLNNTKVIPAQLRGERTATGGRWQGLFLGTNDAGDWRLVCKTRGRLQPMEKVTLTDRDGRDSVTLWLLEQRDDGEWLARPESELSHLELLESVGRVPLPPYIRAGQMVDSDVRDYQTAFASTPGAVAAPTAGLHFTKELLSAIQQSGIETSAVTLHVGRGTFRPIEDQVEDHPMHSEWAEITDVAAQEINATRTAGQRVISIGTTVTRTLETVARVGDARPQLSAWSGETDIFIRPPYEFQAIDGLLTNFHFPKTTLLLLVQAFAGSKLTREAYEAAIREEYRFYSYGDAMLIL